MIKQMFTGFFFLWVSILNAQDHGYPVPPKTHKLMFYIQRNHNSNTIVYEANFDEKGNLVKDDPLQVCWIRYDEEGQRMELRTIEKWYAYGLRCRPSDKSTDSYSVELVAFNERPLELIQKGKNKAEIRMQINHKEAVLDHVYIQADNSGIWPKVKYVELFGYDEKEQHDVYEKIIHQ